LRGIPDGGGEHGSEGALHVVGTSSDKEVPTAVGRLVSEINGIMMNQLHDARFLRDGHAAERAGQTWQRLLSSYRA